MSGKAILTCRPSSHPFKERTLLLEQPVKIGRSVAKSRVAAGNAIFDCKVLSRNHAVLWYSNGKFYLQDTKSSNGTFVNNERLSKSGEESLPREVNSGDVVQFGVDVLESSRKVNHGCIVANLKLYLPDGKEAKASDASSTSSSCSSTLDGSSCEPPFEQLCELRRSLMDATHRELVLEKQLENLQAVFKHIGDQVQNGWKSLIKEDRLLMRVDALEDQLCSKNVKDHEELRKEISKLHCEKNYCELVAKERIKKAIEEKMKVDLELLEAKRALGIIEAQYKAVTVDLEKSHEQSQELNQMVNEQTKKYEEASARMKEIEIEYRDYRNERLEAKNKELEGLLGKTYSEESLETLTDTRLPSLKIADDSFLKKIIKEENESDESNEDSEYWKNKWLKVLENKDASDLLSGAKDMHLEVKHVNEKRLLEIDAKIESLENELREAAALRASNNVPENESIDDECEAKELEIEQLKDEREVVELKLKNNEMSWNSVKEDLGLLQTERLDESVPEYSVNLSGPVLGRNPKRPRIDDGTVSDGTITRSGDNKTQEEEIQILKQLLTEAQQLDKQRRNEMAQWKDRFTVVSRQLENRNIAEDNKLMDELQDVKDKYSFLTTKCSVLEADVKALTEQDLRLKKEKKSLESRCSELQSSNENYEQKLSESEHKLVALSDKYIKCREERNNVENVVRALRKECKNGDRLTNMIILQVIFVLFTVIIMFYPSLSYFMGTADEPEK